MSDRLQPTEREATVRITVDLPESLHKRLSIYCATSGNKKAEVVRVLLDEYLSQQGVKDDSCTALLQSVSIYCNGADFNGGVECDRLRHTTRSP